MRRMELLQGMRSPLRGYRSGPSGVSRLRPRQGSAFVPLTENLADAFCVQEGRAVNNDNTVRYRTLNLQIPEDEHRHCYVKAKGPWVYGQHWLVDHNPTGPTAATEAVN